MYLYEVEDEVEDGGERRIQFLIINTEEEEALLTQMRMRE